MAKVVESGKTAVIAIPWLGTSFTVLSGLSFLIICMLLPMVGQAGNAMPFARQNRLAFALFVISSLALSMLAIASKLARRKADNSPLPWLSIALSATCVLLLLALFGGLLAI